MCKAYNNIEDGTMLALPQLLLSLRLLLWHGIYFNSQWDVLYAIFAQPIVRQNGAQKFEITFIFAIHSTP